MRRSLNKLKNQVYKNAVAHGWHDEQKSDEHWLCMVITELMEAVDADRKERYANKPIFVEWQGNSIPLCEETRIKRFQEDFEAYIKDRVEDELADVCIRLLDYVGVKQADLELYDYKNSSTEDFSDLNFTESMFMLCKYMTDEFYNDSIPTLLNEVFAFCKSRNIDIFWFIEQKMKYNELRPVKHGNLKY